MGISATDLANATANNALRNARDLTSRIETLEGVVEALISTHVIELGACRAHYLRCMVSKDFKPPKGYGDLVTTKQ